MFIERDTKSIFTLFPVTIPRGLFLVLDKLNLKFVWRGESSRADKTVMMNNNEVRRGVHASKFLILS